MTLMQLQNSPKNVWTHTVIVASELPGIGSPRWLEMM